MIAQIAARLLQAYLYFRSSARFVPSPTRVKHGAMCPFSSGNKHKRWCGDWGKGGLNAAWMPLAFGIS